MEQEARPAPVQRIQPPQQREPRLHVELEVCFPKERFDPVWAKIAPYVEELANQSAGEYHPYVVAHSLIFGASHLYMGYLRDPEKTWVGFMVVKYLQENVHIWQAYVLPQFRHLNLLPEGLAYIEAEIAQIGGKEITFSAIAKEYGPAIEALGFSRGYTVFRKRLR